MSSLNISSYSHQLPPCMDFPPQEGGTLVLAEIENSVEHWRKQAHGLPDDKRQACMRTVEILRKKILIRFSQMMPKKNATAIRDEAERFIHHLNQTASGYFKDRSSYAEGQDSLMHKTAEINRKIEALEPSPFHNHDPDHGNASSLFKTIAKGETAHRVGHRFAKGSETGMEWLLELPEEPVVHTNNPVRDRLVSSAAHVAIAGAVHALVPKPIPAYLAIAGAEGIALAAHALEPAVKRMKDHVDSVDAGKLWDELALDDTGGEYPTTSQLLDVAQIGLKAVQIPAQAIHKLHHEIAKTASDACDAIGLTDGNVVEEVRRLIGSSEQEFQEPNMEVK